MLYSVKYQSQNDRRRGLTIKCTHIKSSFVLKYRLASKCNYHSTNYKAFITENHLFYYFYGVIFYYLIRSNNHILYNDCREFQMICVIRMYTRRE